MATPIWKAATAPNEGRAEATVAEGPDTAMSLNLAENADSLQQQEVLDALPVLVFLERAGSSGDSDPAYAEHIGEEFVSHAESVRVRTILHHQQPAAKTRINLMKSRTRGGRGELSHQHADITAENLLQSAIACQLLLKWPERDAPRRARSLHQGMQGLRQNTQGNLRA